MKGLTSGGYYALAALLLMPASAYCGTTFDFSKAVSTTVFYVSLLLGICLLGKGMLKDLHATRGTQLKWSRKRMIAAWGMAASTFSFAVFATVYFSSSITSANSQSLQANSAKSNQPEYYAIRNAKINYPPALTSAEHLLALINNKTSIEARNELQKHVGDLLAQEGKLLQIGSLDAGYYALIDSGDGQIDCRFNNIWGGALRHYDRGDTILISGIIMPRQDGQFLSLGACSVDGVFNAEKEERAREERCSLTIVGGTDSGNAEGDIKSENARVCTYNHNAINNGGPAYQQYNSPPP